MHVVRNRPYEVIELLIAHAIFLVVIAESRSERYLPSGNQKHHRLHSLEHRLPASDISGKDHQIRLLHLQYLTYTLQCNVGAGVIRNVMHVRELDNLELALPVETHSGLGKCRNHQEQC